MTVVSGTRARNGQVEATLNHPFPAQATHGADSGHATRKTLDPHVLAWKNKLYSGAVSTKGAAKDLKAPKVNVEAGVLKPGHRRPLPPPTKGTSREDQFVVVEDGVVEVLLLDTASGAKHTHTLWPKDFVYCNERPGAHPLDALGEFKDSVVLELRPVTPAQLTFVHGDVFSQAINQPSMQLVNVYLVERFRQTPPPEDVDASNDAAR